MPGRLILHKFAECSDRLTKVILDLHLGAGGIVSGQWPRKCMFASLLEAGCLQKVEQGLFFNVGSYTA